jgi:hypothetical protein
MIMRSAIKVAVVVMLLAVAACGEKPQTVSQGGLKKEDSKAWDNTQGRFMASGWQPGDKASWDAQMRDRAQGQNEYSRIAAVPTAAK